ncbi:MAG: hypothetical protein ACYDDS_13385 [Candidatus Sulfotelmatobacter sp.]
MSDKREEELIQVREEHESDLGRGANPKAPASTYALGDPMTIDDVATLLGCSPWTVRQRYLPQGLPHLRTCASGKLVFFREQIIAWILKRQQQRQKGGQLR